MLTPEEEYDKKYFDELLNRFESIWNLSFQGRSISKSAAFQAFVTIDQTSTLCRFFENEDIDEDDERWKTKQ